MSNITQEQRDLIAQEQERVNRGEITHPQHTEVEGHYVTVLDLPTRKPLYIFWVHWNKDNSLSFQKSNYQKGIEQAKQFIRERAAA